MLLKPREIAILRYIAEGKTNREIGEELKLDEATVKGYVSQIYDKLDLKVRKRVEAIKKAQELDLIKGPVHLTSFFQLPTLIPGLIGREDDIKEMQKLLLEEESRLITIHGSPGIGKTRLVLQIAHNLRPSFKDGVAYVDLAPVTNSQFVPQAIINTLQIKPTGNQLILDALLEAFRNQYALLVLDNFEHVIDAFYIVDELLRKTQHLKILVTSREVLKLHAEQIYPLEPLSLPNLQGRPSADELSRSASVILFVHRAQAVQPNFQITDNNAQTIGEICLRLEGIPLAIELAAARIRVSPPITLLKELSQSLVSLSNKLRIAPKRHKTLRAAIDLSYEMLTKNEKLILMRMSAFVGGANLAGIEMVCNPTNSIDVSSILEALLDKSLIGVVSDKDEPRYTLLQTIREYAFEQLTKQEEVTRILAAHAEYYLRLAEKADNELSTDKKQFWLSYLKSNNSNLQAVFDWMLDQGQLEEGLRLCNALTLFWHNNGHTAEGRYWLEKFISEIEQTKSVIPPEIMLQSREGIFSFAWVRGDYKEAKKFADLYAKLCQDGGTDTQIARSFRYLGGIEIAFGQYNQARAHFEDSMKQDDNAQIRWSTSFALTGIGEVAYLQGDYEAATRYYSENLKHANVQPAISAALNGLSKVADMTGDYRLAITYANKSLRLARAENDKVGIAIASNRLGRIARQQGEFDKAQKYHDRSLRIAKQIGSKPIIALTLNRLGELARDQGNYEKALNYHSRALVSSREMGDPYVECENLSWVVLIHIDANNIEQARLSLMELLSSARNIEAKMLLLKTIACFLLLYFTQKDFEQCVYLLGFLLKASPVPADIRKRLDTIHSALETQLSSKRFGLLFKRGEDATIDHILQEIDNRIHI